MKTNIRKRCNDINFYELCICDCSMYFIRTYVKFTRVHMFISPSAGGFDASQLVSSFAGFCSTISVNSFSGAIMISCCLEGILMKLTLSFSCSEVTVDSTLVVNCLMSEPYSIVYF